jgi:hypothetical protein
MQIVKISSEDEAWTLLAQSLNGLREETDEPVIFDFEHWLSLNIHLPETKLHASITPTMMEAFLELQRSIYRSFVIISAHTPDLRYLTSDQRESLEFRVRVEKGSSIYDVDLTAVIEKIGIEAVSKMDPNTLAITILGLALIIGGSWAFRAWLAAKTEQRRLEVEGQERQAELEMLKLGIQQNTETTRILAEAISRQPLLADVDAIMEPARQQLVQSIGKDGGGDVLGTRIEPKLAQELSGQKRQQSEEILVKGSFKVVRVDTTSPDGFRVTLAGGGLPQEVTASLLEYVVSTDHREAIKQAEWEKCEVYIEMKAKRIRERIFEAVVTLAEIRPQGV